MLPIPLQFINSFLIKLNVGDVILVGFVLGVFATWIKSQKLMAIHTITFSALLLLTPSSLFEPAELSLLSSILQYKFVGLTLLIIAPVLFTTADS
jgi:hypothetical protein